MLLWSGQVVSTVGSAATAIVYPLLILSLTNSPAAAGFASAIRAVPYLLFSLPVGALIDRWDRKRTMIVCNAGCALAALSVALALWFDALTVWQIYVVAFVEGTLFVFFNIAEVAALPRVVPPEDLARAAAQNEAAFGATQIAGPSVGTLMYQTLGRGAPFVADAISYLVSLIALLFIRSEFRIANSAPPPPLAAAIAEGMRWLWNKPLIRYMAFLTGGVNFVNAAIPLIVIVIATQMGANALDIGLVFSIGGLGGIIGAMIGGRIQRRFRFGQVITCIIWAEAALFPLYLIAPKYLWLGVIYALMYTLGPVYNVVQFSYRLSIIPDALQGRVNSTFRLLAFGLNPIGAAAAGLLLQYAGTSATVIAFAVWYLGLAILTGANRHVRNA